jgi:hypothetical protein
MTDSALFLRFQRQWSTLPIATSCSPPVTGRLRFRRWDARLEGSSKPGRANLTPHVDSGSPTRRIARPRLSCSHSCRTWVKQSRLCDPSSSATCAMHNRPEARPRGRQRVASAETAPLTAYNLQGGSAPRRRVRYRPQTRGTALRN